MTQRKKKDVKKIDNFEINLHQRLGQGSYGGVYKAKDIRNEEPRAIKIVPKKKLQNQYFKLAFRTEIKVMVHLNSNVTVKCYEVLETQHNYYIVEQLCNSGNFRHFLKKYNQPIKVDNAVILIRKILKCFYVLALKGIIHRDVKPQNILIHDNIIKIGDFGFSKASDGRYLYTCVGTPHYMAPQLLKNCGYTYKCDIWSLGVIFYEILYGKKFFPPHTTNMNIWLQKNTIQFPPLYGDDQQTKAKLINFVKKCLQIEQQNRYGWNEIFGHQLFKSYFNLSSDFKLNYIFTNIRYSIHSQNIDVMDLLKKFHTDLSFIDFEKFTYLMKTLSQDVNVDDVKLIFDTYRKKNQVGKQQINLKTLIELFKKFGIETKSISVEEIMKLSVSNSINLSQNFRNKTIFQGYQETSKHFHDTVLQPQVVICQIMSQQTAQSPKNALYLNLIEKISKQKKQSACQHKKQLLQTIAKEVGLQHNHRQDEQCSCKKFNPVVVIGQLAKKIQRQKLQLYQLYKQFDTNGDFSLSFQEFFLLLKVIDQSLTKEEAKQVFNIFDVEHNEQISFNQFYNALCQITGQSIRFNSEIAAKVILQKILNFKR